MEKDTDRLTCSHFCGTCHGVEHDEWESLYLASRSDCQPADGCAECHMPAYKDRLTQGHLMSYAHPKRVVRDHSFFTWSEQLVRGAIVAGRPQITPPQGEMWTADFTLTNRGAGHRIPTGKFGYRELRIVVELLDADRRVISDKETSLLGGKDEGLIPGKATPFQSQFRVPHGARPESVRILVERVNRDKSLRVSFVDQTWLVEDE
jgi:hypothetical protein